MNLPSVVARYPFSKYFWTSAFNSSARSVAARFGVFVGRGVAVGLRVCVAVGAMVAVAVSVGSGVFVGVGCEVAQAGETKIAAKIIDIRVYRRL